MHRSMSKNSPDDESLLEVNINNPKVRLNPWDDKKNELHHGISQFVKHLARRIGLEQQSGIISCDQSFTGLLYKSPLQEEGLQNLRHRFGVSFDASLVEHQDALRQVWRLAYPKRAIPSLKSELWKEMGWQGVDPSTDFRLITFKYICLCMAIC